MGKIRESIPVGFNHHTKKQALSGVEPSGPITQQEWQAAHHQVGTLGGGNHFIELQQGSDGHVWAMVHSGSRNVGLKVAKHYHAIARTLNEQWHVSIDPAWDLAFLPLDTPEGRAYLDEMRVCQNFALENRRSMMDRIVEAFSVETGAKEEWRYDISHNYARMEHHHGREVMVHRKGAISAREGEIGIIPGSQGTSSYIVKGKGHPESFMSSSHGAGRQMGRTAAQRTLSLADEQRRLDERGILHAIRGVRDLDEAPGAYKDIDMVMKEQSELTEIVTTLEPLAVIKA
jgi:tRNA-splicing ligase RtcB